MLKIENRIKTGTRVLMNINGVERWCIVVEINDTRVHFKVSEYAGSFQAGHIIKFSNK